MLPCHDQMRTAGVCVLTCCNAILTTDGDGGPGICPPWAFSQVRAVRMSGKSQGQYQLSTAKNGHNAYDCRHAHLFESFLLACEFPA